MNLLNMEEEKFKEIEVKGYKFKIRAMSPKDRRIITQRRVFLQNGQPVSSFTDDDFYYLESLAMNDICIEKMPDPEGDNFKPNMSCDNWDDVDLINLVANEIRKHTAYIEEELKKNRPSTGIVKG